MSDPMRSEYRSLTDDEKEQIKNLKQIGAHFHDYLEQMGQSRELSLAKTKLEEAVMWATKHVTR